MELTQYLDLNVKLFEMIGIDGGSKKFLYKGKIEKISEGVSVIDIEWVVAKVRPPYFDSRY